MNNLKLVVVASLPTPRDGFVDCSAIGCEAGGVRLKTTSDESLWWNCESCRHLLIHTPGEGWRIKVNSRAEIAQRREEAREKYAPRIGAGWEKLRRMRRAA